LEENILWEYEKRGPSFPMRWRRILSGGAMLGMLVLAGCQNGAAVAQTSIPPLLTSTPTVSGMAGFRVWHDPIYGFSLQTPDQVTVNAQRSTTGLTVLDNSQTANPNDPTTYLEVDILAQTTPSATLCTGTPVTVGGNIPGFEHDQFIPPTPSPTNVSMHLGRFEVEFVSQGLDMTIRLYSGVTGNDLVKLETAAWQFMLGSFIPAPTMQGSVQPCT
jgi:hypothetical protein